MSVLKIHIAIGILITLSLASSCLSDAEEKPNPTASSKLKGKLTLAAAHGDANEMLTLLKAGADPGENVGTQDKPLTPLLAAIANRHEQVALQLLSYYRQTGLSVEREGYTLFDFAAYQRMFQLADQISADLLTLGK